MIKFYGDKNAILVAGYEAMETQAACSVLADYKTYGLSGTEMTVLATNLDSISVQKVIEISRNSILKYESFS
jgi:hypothetical protein